MEIFYCAQGAEREPLQIPAANLYVTKPKPSSFGRVTLMVSSVVGAIMVAILIGMALEMAARPPGFDFRYFWVAGRLWLDGVSPYGNDIAAQAGVMIGDGHVPVIWPYPPTLWLPTVILAVFPFEVAWKVWLALHVLMMIGGSALVAVGLPRLRLTLGRRDIVVSRPLFFSVHLALMTFAEAHLFAFFNGQMTALFYLGAVVMLVGLSRGRDAASTAGLTILMMKPHIGAAVALGLLISGARGRRIVVGAGLLSCVLMLPALAIAPTVISDWLYSLGRYDGVSAVNRPEAMTGLRNLVQILGHVSIGNATAALAGLAVAACVALRLKQWYAVPGGGHSTLPESVWITHLGAAMILIALAVSPLHIYDFLLIGVLLPLIPLRRPARSVIALVALAVMWIASPLCEMLGGTAASPLLAGTTVTTIAAAMLIPFAFSRHYLQPAR